MHNFVVSQHSLGHPVKHIVRAGPPAAAATGEQQPCSAPPHDPGPPQGPRGDQECEQAEARPPPQAPHRSTASLCGT